MRRNGYIPSCFLLFAFLALCGPLACAVVVYSESQANLVLQWGNSRALGVGPYATGELFVPPTPNGVYEEGNDTLSIIPLTASSYLHSSNGAMYMVITTDPSGNNRFFVAGMTSGGENNRYPTPVEVTSMIPCDGSFCLQSNAQIFDFELLDGMLAFVLLRKDLANTVAVMTMKFMWDANLPPVPLGRTGNLVLPGGVASWAHDGNKANLTCGPTYCVSLSTKSFLWGTVGSVDYPLTPLYDSQSPQNGITSFPLEWVGAMKDGLIVIDTNGTVHAFGNNSGQVFGESITVASGESVFQFGTTRLADLACGLDHCVYVLPSGLVGAWGNNNEGQCGANPDSEPTVAFGPGRTIPGLTNIRLVGAVGTTSYALGVSQLYAWGTNMLDSTTQYYPGGHSPFGDSWFGMPTFLRRNHVPTLITGLPSGISLTRAPKMPTMSGWGSANRAVSVPVHATQASFDNLRRNHLGISPRTTTNLAGTNGLLIWGSGLDSDFSYPKGLIFANRSASTRVAFAFPRIVELPTGLTLSNFSVSTNQISTFLYDTNAVFTWGIIKPNGIPLGVPNYGEDHSMLSTMVPFPVKLDNTAAPTPKFLTIASAKRSSCGIWVNNSIDMVVDCWGEDAQNPTVPLLTQEVVMNSICPLHQLTCGEDFCAFICDSDQVYLSWANSANSPFPWLGHDNPNLPTIDSMNMTALGSANVIKMALGVQFSIIIASDGIYACGKNNQFALGHDDPYIEYNIPTLLWNTVLSDVVAGSDFVLGLNNGQVFSWGSNWVGQLGRNIGNPWDLGQVILPHPVVSIAAVSTTSFAITDRGDLYAWGRNDFCNMFGAPLVGLGHSTLPRLINLNESLRYDFRVTSILSSTFSNNVLAKGVFLGSGSYPPTEPALATLSRFGVSIDLHSEVDSGDRSPSSPTLPASVFRLSKNVLDLKPGEVIQGASHTATIDTLWTNSSIYSNYEARAPTQNQSSPLSPQRRSFEPLLLFSDPSRLVLGADNHLAGIVYVLSDGSAWALGQYSTVSIPGSYSSLSCAIFYCVFEASSTHDLILLNNTLGQVSYPNTIPSNGRYTVPGYGAASDIDLFLLQPSIHFMAATTSSITLYNITGENAITTDVTGAFSGVVQLLVSGYDHFLALSTNGKLYGYGNNQYRQLPVVSGIETSFQQIFGSGQLASSQIVNLAATTRTSFAIDSNGRVFAWGYIPSEGPNMVAGVTPETLSTAYGLAHIYEYPRILQRLPPSSGIVGEKFRPFGQAELPPLQQASRLFHLSYYAGPYVPSPQTPSSSTPGTNTPVPGTNSPIVFPPSSVTLPPLEPPGPACPPPPNSGNWACDAATGTLYLAGNLQVNPGTPIVLTGPIVIVGDFSLPPGATFEIKLTSNIFSSSGSSGQKRSVNDVFGTTPTAATNEPLVTVSGCASVDSPISLDPDEEAVKEIKKGGEKGKAINIVESSCTQTPGKLLVEGGPDSQKGCRRYTAQQQETTSGGRTTLSAIMVVNRDTCNHGWIIAVCIVAVVVVAAVIVAILLVKIPALRRKVLPYHGAN